MMKVKVGVSNRHVHLTKETFKTLFGKDNLTKRNDLNQIGEFAALESVTIKYEGKIIDKVRIVGPFRPKNQIELLGSDLAKLGLDAPTRRSGDLEGTPSVDICNGDMGVHSSGVIRSERHVHVPTSREEEFGLHERDRVSVECPSGTFDAFVKVSDNSSLELHIDKDEAEIYGLKSEDEVTISLCGR